MSAAPDGKPGSPRPHVRWRALVLATALVALAGPRAAAAPRVTLQVDPLTTALGFVHLQVELVLDPRWSIYVGPSLKLFGGLLAKEDDVAYTGLGAEVGVRYYLSGDAPRGGWVLIRGVLAHLSTDDPPTETSVGGYVSALGGYTWIVDDRWVFALGLGLQYLDYTVAGSGPEGVLPAAHTTLGLCF